MGGICEMKILRIEVEVEGGDKTSHVMENPIFKVKFPDGGETIYDLEVTGIEMGMDRRIIVLRPATISKVVHKGG
jgi:hypothetical protein